MRRAEASLAGGHRKRTFDRRTGELSGSLSGSARFTSKRTAETKSL